jgi:DNA-binding transcriptional LysR family regulator
VTVADELHFGRAAERLRIAQPSLSHQIRRLEQQLGVTLLDRTSRRVELTPAGQTLLKQGGRLLAQAQRVVQATRAAASERLTVGFHGSTGSALLSEVLRTFGEQRPAVEVSIHELRLDRLDELTSGQVDVALTRLVPGQAELEIEVLEEEPRFVALTADHPLARRQTLRFRDLRRESFITNPIADADRPPERWLAEQRRHGLPGRVASEAASIQEILALVSAGRGICLVPRTVAVNYPRPDVRYVLVADADPAVVSVAWTREAVRPVVEAFIETARDVAEHHSAAGAAEVRRI